MKNLLAILTTVCFTVVLSSQVPEKMSYQAVIRDASGQLVTTQIGIQISIIQDNSDISYVYQETQTTTPNANGLITIEIGGADPETFADINWSDGPHSLMTEVDPTGGTNYTISGTSQILSVPYALHAKSVETFSETQSLSDVILINNSANGQIKNLTDPSEPQDAVTKAYVDVLESKLELKKVIEK